MIPPAKELLNPSARVLVVEDDPTNREFLRRALGRQGYAITIADGVPAAQATYLAQGDGFFNAVITDYRMPLQTGLELLNWLTERDPCLATIILTAEGEKELVTESLRAGASDFLEKPVNLQKLLPALTKAVSETQRRRHLAETEHAVKKLGQSQMSLINLQPIATPGGWTAHVEVCFHPKVEAGGDFFCHFQPTPDTLFCLLTDVSGHDLEAAYVSAYFQGLVRGMLHGATPVPEIFDRFNRFLLEEWNRTGTFRQPEKTNPASVAATSVFINFTTRNVSVLNSGAPAPVYTAPNGCARVLGASGGSPLGWFPDAAASSSEHAALEGGNICYWTDGLEDLAGALEIHPLCLAWVLEHTQASGEKIPQLAEAQDDILVARIYLPTAEKADDPAKSLFLMDYHGAQTGEIDQLEATWRRNLQFAIRDVSDLVLHDVLLAAREAVLNAMEHGCAGDGQQRLTFQMSYQPRRARLIVRVADPGPGHQFDFTAHEQLAAQKILDEHRGLIFIMNLAHSVKFARNGATVIMEFQLATP